jgi:hypothetical protein
MSGTLKQSCTTENWGNDTGIMVCRIYKVLFTFTITSFSTQVLAVGLDYFTRRAKNRRNVYNTYNAMEEETKERASILSDSSSNDPSVDALNAFGTSRPAPKVENPPAQYPISETGTHYASDTTHGVTWNSNPLPYPNPDPALYPNSNSTTYSNPASTPYQGPAQQGYTAYNPGYQPFGDRGYRR